MQTAMPKRRDAYAADLERLVREAAGNTPVASVVFYYGPANNPILEAETSQNEWPTCAVRIKEREIKRVCPTVRALKINIVQAVHELLDSEDPATQDMAGGFTGDSDDE